MCGCAARNARPAVTLALANAKKPAKLTTVFAGQDAEATERARSYITGYRPSSPSIALFKDGRLAFMLERNQIEGRRRGGDRGGSDGCVRRELLNDAGRGKREAPR